MSFGPARGAAYSLRTPRHTVRQASPGTVSALVHVAVGAMTFLLIAQVAITSLPANALLLRVSSPRLTQRYLPQGWSFFTRDPQESQITVQQLTSRGLMSPMANPQRAASNAFGLNRWSRAQHAELRRLLALVPAAAWTHCMSDDVICVAQRPTLTMLSGTELSARYRLCGRLSAIRRTPMSWIEAHFRQQRVRVSDKANLLVSCSVGR